MVRVLRLMPALVALLLLAGAMTGAPGGARAQAAPAGFVPGRVVLRVAPGHAAPYQALAQTPEAHVARVGQSARYVTVSVPPGREEEFRRRLASLPSVQYAELDALRQPSFLPNDENFGRQWNMRFIQADRAWDVTQGLGTTIAVVDTGVAFENYLVYKRSPELFFTRFVDPYDAVTQGTHPNDETGHGTHVTGTLAQDTNNYFGQAGIAARASIMPIKVCQPTGCASSDVADGIYWAVDHGADVINMSLGGAFLSSLEREALEYAEDSGVVVVAAAGNGGVDFVGDDHLEYPAAYPTVISAGAVRYDGTLARYSNFGFHEGGLGLHVVAPGGDTHVDQDGDGSPDGILQNTYAFTCSDAPQDYRSFKDCMYVGTSMSTPHVSGTVALLLSRFPGLTPGQVRHVLACSARDLGLPGYGEQFGAGAVQAYEALRDDDEDGVPNCLEEPPALTVSASNTIAAPGRTVRIAISGSATYPGLGKYTIDVFFDRQVVELIDCIPVKSDSCTPAVGNLQIRGAEPEGLSGEFRLAFLDFRVIGAVGTSSVLQVGLASAQSVTLSEMAVTLGDGAVLVREEGTGISGDATCDLLVDVEDALGVLLQVSGADAVPCGQFADVDCSHAIDSLDALAILRFIAALEVALPSGCPAIGTPPGDLSAD